MKIEIKVPELGDGIDQVDVAAVEVAAGALVEINDTLVTLETDKAAMDIPAEVAGTVVSVAVKAGDKLAEGDLLAVIEVIEVAETVAEATPAEVSGAVESPIEPVPAPAPAPQQVAGASRIELVVCPPLGDGIDKAEVVAISVAPGDSVTVEETLLTLETDKAAMDLPAPVAGKILAIKIALGDQVTDGDLLAEIETTGEVAVEPAANRDTPSTPTAPTQPPSVAQPSPPPAGLTTPATGKAHASPAVRQFARELGAELTAISGTGRKGRITREDVTAFVKSVLTGSASAGGGAGLEPLPVYDHSKWGETEEVSLSKVRQLTARNLSRSWPQIPQVTQFDEADITELEAFRQAQKELASKQGIRLTLLALVMKAVVGSLRSFPDFNASLHAEGDRLVLKKFFHIGVAVETPGGLVVPVVRDVEQKGVFTIAEELGDLSARARDRKLRPEEMQGSSFTISSLGGIGGTAFTPVVNHPNVAILGLSRSSMKPVWDGSEFKPRLILPLSLSYDHRVIDGAVAARFGRDLAENLQDFRRCLL